MEIGRRRMLAASAAAALLAACGGAPAAGPAAKNPLVKEPAKEGWTPVLPSSDLAVGPNRFLYAVIDERNRPILDAEVRLRFFDLSKGEAPPVAEADAPFRGQGLGNKGVYVARVEFPSAGAWGVEAAIKRPDGSSRSLRTRFEVKPESQTPKIGSPAPASRQELMAGASDPRKICTAVPACAFHDMTIADALALKKPAFVLFATPGYCSSAVCGPDLETMVALEPSFRGRVSFLHLEIYADPATQAPTATVQQWRLPSEPWVFLVDREGRIADKLEGGLTQAELREALERLV